MIILSPPKQEMNFGTLLTTRPRLLERTDMFFQGDEDILGHGRLASNDEADNGSRFQGLLIDQETKVSLVADRAVFLLMDFQRSFLSSLYI